MHKSEKKIERPPTSIVFSKISMKIYKILWIRFIYLILASLYAGYWHKYLEVPSYLGLASNQFLVIHLISLIHNEKLCNLQILKTYFKYSIALFIIFIIILFAICIILLLLIIMVYEWDEFIWDCCFLCVCLMIYYLLELLLFLLVVIPAYNIFGIDKQSRNLQIRSKKK